MYMNLSSIQLEAFYTLSQTQNFTLGAKRLGITQSALSQRIFNLEQELESTLFIRHRRGLQLTETGLSLLRYCQAKDSLEKEFLNGLKAPEGSGFGGQIRIGGFSSITHSILLPAISPILIDNPGVRLYLLTREVSELLPALNTGEVDFVILDRKVEKAGIVSVSLGEELNVLVERKGYEGPDIYLDHDEEDKTTESYFRLHRKKGKLDRHSLDDIHGILQGVELGLGRAVVPRHLIQGRKNLRILHPKTQLRVPLFLHYFEQSYYSQLHRQVESYLISNVSQLLRSQG